MTRLEQNERSIIAGFRTMQDAEKAKKELEQMGVLDSRIDRVSLYNVSEFEERNHNPITANYPGLAIATFDTDMDRDQSILASANPSAYSMSDGNDEEVGRDVVLTVVIDEKKYDQAADIVRKHGGEF